MFRVEFTFIMLKACIIIIIMDARKINYYTYMAMAGEEAIAGRFHMGTIPEEKNGKKYAYSFSLMEEDDGNPILYHDIVRWGTAAMKKNCMEAMKIFSMR